MRRLVLVDTELYLDIDRISRLLSSKGFVWAVASFQLPQIKDLLQQSLGLERGRAVFKTILNQVKVVKTPAYIDIEELSLTSDVYCYLLKLAAEAIDAVVITKNKELIKSLPQKAFSPDDIRDVPEKMAFCDLKRQYWKISAELERGFDNIFKHQRFINGPEIKELEDRLAKFIGVRHAIGVSSGTDALFLALMAIGIKPGNYVITTAFTFAATAEVIALLGAKPLFVDIEPNTYNISLRALQQLLDQPKEPSTKRPINLQDIKAIIAVDLYGYPADYEEIRRILPAHMVLIEDAAQAMGAEYEGQKAGGLADIGITSFFPSKPLGGYGDGGMVFTNDDDLAFKVRCLRDHGQVGRYQHKFIGINGRLDSFQAAVLLAKFDLFKEEITRRREIALKYQQGLKGLSQKGLLKLPPEPNSSVKPVWAQYTIATKRRNKLQTYLESKGIPTAVHYPQPLPFQEAFRYLGYQQGDFPYAEKAAQEVLSLPMDAWKSDEEIAYIVNEINHFFQ